MRKLVLLLGVITALATLSACGGPPDDSQRDVAPLSAERDKKLDQAFAALVEKHDVMTAGAAIITDGEVSWTGYFGEQTPGQAATSDTQFDVASITKTVAAETVLRLVEAGEVSLDESMAPYWVDPDVEDDPRHADLTPRMVLNHTTGFPNWRFFLDDNKLRFLNDPGESYGYSGEGFEYLARFAENKLGVSFPELVRRYTFEPVGMTGVSYSVREANFPRFARPVDEAGTFHGHYCRPETGWCRKEGDYSAADDMRITVADHAKFLISVMNADGYGDVLATERNRVQLGRDGVASDDVICTSDRDSKCPDAQGYGLGWSILDYGDYQLVGHGGSDWSEVALAYFYTHSRDGIVVFLNAPNIRALGAMPEAIALLDPASPMIEPYQRWLEISLAARRASDP